VEDSLKKKNIYSQDYQESPAQGTAPVSGPELEEAHQHRVLLALTM
jgi:hypothetical protein